MTDPPVATDNDSGPGRARPPRATNDQRRAQILDAFMICIGRKGLDRSTIADVAEEAGLQRTLVYHYFKDRVTLIDSLIEYLDESKLMDRFAAVGDTDPKTRMSLLLDTVFDTAFYSKTGEGADAFIELVSLGTRDAHVGAKMHAMWENSIDAFMVLLVDATGAQPEDCSVVAYAMTCIFEHNATMQLLGFGEEQNRQARMACEALIATLTPFLSRGQRRA